MRMNKVCVREREKSEWGVDGQMGLFASVLTQLGVVDLRQH